MAWQSGETLMHSCMEKLWFSQIFEQMDLIKRKVVFGHMRYMQRFVSSCTCAQPRQSIYSLLIHCTVCNNSVSGQRKQTTRMRRLIWDFAARICREGTFLFREVQKICSFYLKNPDKLIVLRFYSKTFIACRIYPKYWDRQAWANSVDPDQTPHFAASDLCLHCLPLRQQYCKHFKR